MRFHRQQRNKGARQRIEAYEAHSKKNYSPPPLIRKKKEAEVEYLPTLFYYFPELAEQIPWVNLRTSSEPSLPQRLLKSHHLFGNNYAFMKQEHLDFIGFSGSEARKLEFIFGECLQRNPKKIITSGILGSPHCLATVQTAKNFGLKSEIILIKGPTTPEAVAQTLWMKGQGTQLWFCSSENQYRWVKKIVNIYSSFSGGEFISHEGICPLGVLSFVNAMIELKAQVNEGLLPSPDFLFTGAHHGINGVGMEIGRRLMGLDSLRIIGIPCESNMEVNRRQWVSLGNEVIHFLNPYLKKPLSMTLHENDFEIYQETPKNYSEFYFEKLKRWGHRFFEVEGIEINSFHMTQALWGMSHYVLKHNLQGKNLLFWNDSSLLDRNRIQKISMPLRLRWWLR